MCTAFVLSRHLLFPLPPPSDYIITWSGTGVPNGKQMPDKAKSKQTSRDWKDAVATQTVMEELV